MKFRFKLLEGWLTVGCCAFALSSCGGSGGGSGGLSTTTATPTVLSIQSLVSESGGFFSVRVASSGDIVFVSQNDVQIVKSVNGVYQAPVAVGYWENDPVYASEIESGKVLVASLDAPLLISIFDQVNGTYVSPEIFGARGSYTGQLQNPVSFSEDSTGNIYIADTTNHVIEKWIPSGSAYSYESSFGSVISQDLKPISIAFDAKGDLVFVDQNSNTVYELSSSGNLIGTVGSNGTNTGQYQTPTSVVTDSRGDAYVSDVKSNAIYEYVPGPVGYEFSHVVGATFASNEKLVPTSLSVDSSSNLYAYDSDHNTITVFPPGS